MLAYWRDWCLMNRLHCTWPQLHETPRDVLLIHDAFMRGEEDGNKAKEALGGS